MPEQKALPPSEMMRVGLLLPLSGEPPCGSSVSCIAGNGRGKDGNVACGI